MKTTTALWLLLAFSTPLAAQDQDFSMAPAPELKKYERFAGHWTGKGSFTGPDGTKMGWTSKATGAWILGKQFLREDLRVDFEVSGVPPYIAVNFHGYDRETKRYQSYHISNEGAISIAEGHWVGGDKHVNWSTTVQNGTVVSTRMITTFNETGYDLKMESAYGAGPFETSLDGKVTRAKEGYKLSAEDEKIALAPAAEEMKRLARMAGTYVMKGKVVPMPGLPAMPVSATEEIRKLFDGSVLLGTIKGDETGRAPTSSRRSPQAVGIRRKSATSSFR
jgi:hypothetical protein